MLVLDAMLNDYYGIMQHAGHVTVIWRDYMFMVSSSAS